MKKVGVVLLMIILLSVSVSAFSLTGYFSSLFSPQETTITGTQANPIKVYPGQSLNILVAFEDPNSIESAVAYFPFEGGQDKVDMILSAGNEKKGTFSATWVVHNTANMKWYKTKIILTNSLGTETITYVDWQDPTQSHPLDQITEGNAVFATQQGFNFSGNARATISAYNNITGTWGYGVQAFVPSTGVSTGTTALYGEGFRGVWGETSVADVGSLYEAIYGVNTATGAVDGVGVKGYAYGNTGRGVFGRATAAGGSNYGVYGQADGNTGSGVYGYASHASGPTRGVYGKAVSSSSTSYGVFGETTSATGYAGYFTGGKGVYSQTNITANNHLTGSLGCKIHGCQTLNCDACQCPAGKFMTYINVHDHSSSTVVCCYC
ncbi:MAG: hypothetical protein KAT77_00240 [Nanoarchaeota archaeon]|nr:hypothetical protein [Nanoarchaeota archaeon]